MLSMCVCVFGVAQSPGKQFTQNLFSSFTGQNFNNCNYLFWQTHRQEKLLLSAKTRCYFNEICLRLFLTKLNVVFAEYFPPKDRDAPGFAVVSSRFFVFFKKGYRNSSFAQRNEVMSNKMKQKKVLIYTRTLQLTFCLTIKRLALI